MKKNEARALSPEIAVGRTAIGVSPVTVFNEDKSVLEIPVERQRGPSHVRITVSDSTPRAIHKFNESSESANVEESLALGRPGPAEKSEDF